MSEPLAAAVRAIAARCDGAMTLDGQGFNGTDTKFGNRLAALDPADWPEGADREAWVMLRKYGAQLAAAGIEYAAIPEPPAPERAAEGAEVRQATRRAFIAAKRRRAAEEDRERVARGEAPAAGWDVEADGAGIWIRFRYDESLIREVRAIPGARWAGDVRRWAVPRGEAVRAVRFGERHDLLIDPSLAAEVADAPEPVEHREVEVEDGLIVVRSPYDPGAIGRMRAIAGRRWDGERRVNTFPLASGAAVIELAEGYGWRVAPELRELIEQRETAAAESREASRAADADLKLTGLGGELMPFQRAGVAYAMRHPRTYIADEMGLGKTVQALAALLAHGAFPAVAVVPASLRLNWEREARKWLPGRSVQVVTGRKAPREGYAADITVLNYEVLSAHVEALRERGIRGVIADEAHYVKNSKAARTRALRQLCGWREERASNGRLVWREGPDGLAPVILLLTGTPVLNQPSELAEPLGIIGKLDEFGGWYGFATRYCGAARGRFGMEWNEPDREALRELNDELRATCLVRRKKADVLTELPPKLPPIRVDIPLANEREYRQAESDLLGFLGEQAERLAAADVTAQERLADYLAQHPDIPVDVALDHVRAAARREAVGAAERAETLVRFNTLRRLAVRGKVDGIAAWVRTFLEGSEEKLLLFAHHVQDGILPLIEALAEHRPVVIHGGTPLAERQAGVDRFQGDPETRLAIIGIEAGGLGLTLTAAAHVAFAELPWVPGKKQQAEDRAHRIGQVSDVQPWDLLAPGTIDEDMAEIIARKLRVADAAQDGVIDDTDDDPAILTELAARMAERAR